MKKRNNNKGMAMVTVLIAITFVGILATSMMYMAYMNYISKSMRYSSTDNFYTSEYGLADLSTALQNKAANASSVSTALNRYKSENIATTSGDRTILTVNPNNPAINCYDCYALEALIQRASKESKIEVFTTYDTDGDLRWPESDNYIMDSKSITFLGVRIRSTTDKGYVSTISTDIKITFDSNPGDLKVNDFSVITDSPIVMDNKDVIVGGNIYIGNRKDATSSDTVDEALVLKNISVMTLLSKRGIIHGDVLIEEGSTLVVTGNLTVYGEITIKKGGTLICTGELIHTEDINAQSGSILKGIDKDHASNPTLEDIGVDGDGDGNPDSFLASAILSSIYAKDNTGWREITLDQILTGNGGLGGAGYKQFKRDESAIDENTISTWFGVAHPNNDLVNSLVISGGREVQIRGDARDSTIISVMPVVYFGDHKTTYMKCMDDESYDKARNILIKGSGQLTCFGTNFSFAGGNLGVDVTFPVAGAEPKVITMPDPAQGIEGRTVYCDGSNNYVPTGYFIAENADSILSSAFAASQGDLDPKNSTVTYASWQKE